MKNQKVQLQKILDSGENDTVQVRVGMAQESDLKQVSKSPTKQISGRCFKRYYHQSLLRKTQSLLLILQN